MEEQEWYKSLLQTSRYTDKNIYLHIWDDHPFVGGKDFNTALNERIIPGKNNIYVVYNDSYRLNLWGKILKEDILMKFGYMYLSPEGTVDLVDLTNHIFIVNSETGESLDSMIMAIRYLEEQLLSGGYTKELYNDNGHIIIFSDESGQNLKFLNLMTGKKRIIVSDSHIEDFPGIDHPELIMRHYKESKSVSNFFGFGSKCMLTEDSRVLIYWRIQPDGRYYEDDDGFGSEDQDEIVLYAFLDENGDFEGKFRVKSIGSIEYMGTNREEREAEIYDSFDKNNKQVSETAITDDEAKQYSLIRSALDSLMKKNYEEQTIQSVIIPIVGETYNALLECRKYDDGSDLFVQIEKKDVAYRMCAASGESLSELKDLTKTERTVDDVYYCICALIDHTHG